MSNGPPRRQLLEALAASSIAVPIAGCIGTLEADDDASAAPTTDEGAHGDTGPDDLACDVGRSIVAAFGDGDFETAVSYYPYEFVADEDEEVDPSVIAADLEASSRSRFEWVDASVDDVSCECVEFVSDDARAELAADFTGEITDVVELRYSVTYDADGRSATSSAFVRGFEIDSDWYGIFKDYGRHDLCGTEEEVVREPDDSSAEEETIDDQPLEPADWADVDEIVLEGTVPGWVGVEPAPIEGVENPTLLLFEGREYAFEWRNGDGAAHNLQIRDGDDTALAETAFVEETNATTTLTVEATAAMDRYVCEPHEMTMVGAIEVEDA